MYGEIYVELFKPVMSFGQGIHIIARSEGGTKYATVDETGQLVWNEMDPRVQVDHPTLLLDERVYEALAAAILKEPIRSRGQAPYDHLQDAIAVRDRLLAMAELGMQRLVR